MITVKQHSYYGTVLSVAFFALYAFGMINAECANGWIHYENNCYWFSTDQRTWLSAQDNCLAHDGFLAEPRNQSENEYLRSIMKYMQHDPHLSGTFWLGGRDGPFEGRWEWVSNGDMMTYTSWGPNEPNGGEGENCLEIHDKWNDLACTTVARYICQSRFH